MNARQRRVARRKAGRKVVGLRDVRLMIDGIVIEATPTPSPGRISDVTWIDEPLPECSHLWTAETRTLDRCVRCGEVK